MKRVAIVGGGLSGLTAAYELACGMRAGADVAFTLFEQSARFGGTLETVHRDGFTIECGPDGWVSEKRWARELAVELGLGEQLLASKDADRKTYIFSRGRLRAIPAGMRMMVPTDLDAVGRSDLFSRQAVRAFHEEVQRAELLRESAPISDESIASFTRRHFGNEVLATVAAPLLSGIFGGDVRQLSVRAVMPMFVAMEREHGSLIRGLQARQAERDGRVPESLFTTLRGGLSTLTNALAAQLPERSVRRSTRVLDLRRESDEWVVQFVAEPTPSAKVPAVAARPHEQRFEAVVLATPLETTRDLLQPLDRRAARLLPQRASSAIIVALAWSDARLCVQTTGAEGPATFETPPGFGLLVPPARGVRALFAPRLLAVTFVEQKFSDRVPAGGHLLRAFFGGVAARSLRNASDDRIVSVAMDELQQILGRLPRAAPFAVVRRWPESLPQYEVGHLERVAELERLLPAAVPGLHVLGNALHGVGLPDLIRESRVLARQLLT